MPGSRHAWNHSSPVLSLAGVWCSKLHILKSLAGLCLAQFSLRKAVVCLHRYLEFMLKHSKTCRPGYLPSVHASVPCCWTGTQWPQWAFCPWRGKILSSKYTPGMGVISSSVTQGIPTLRHLVGTLQHWSFSHSLLFPNFVHEKGPLPFVALQLISPLIQSPKPHICHILSLQLCKLFS